MKSLPVPLPASTHLISTESVSRFFDINSQPILTTYTSATITILPANVPEPSTTLLLGLTGVVGFGVSRFRKRRQAATTAA